MYWSGSGWDGSEIQIILAPPGFSDDRFNFSVSHGSSHGRKPRLISDDAGQDQALCERPD